MAHRTIDRAVALQPRCRLDYAMAMDWMADTFSFGLKALMVVASVAASAAIIAAFARRRDGRDAEARHLRVEPLDRALKALADTVRRSTMAPREYKREHKQARALADKRAAEPRPRVFVLDFKGDVLASAVDSLRHEVSALCAGASQGDEVVLRLESAGGAAHSYGLGASQLARLKDRGLKLTVCIDKVAASGGYLMACVADAVVAAPFALVGSIGVVAPLPNLHRLLDRFGVDYENVTAGKYKRTVSFLAENTEEGRRKFQAQLEDTHSLFKDFVKQHRPALDIEAVATGEYWHGQRAVELGLVDRLATSDDYLMSKLDGARLYRVRYRRPKSWRERVATTLRLAGDALLGTP